MTASSKGVFKVLGLVVVIGIILLPMVIYLSPFTWFMRRPPGYQPNPATEKQLKTLNKKYKVELYIAGNLYKDTVWYFRDVRNGKADSLENLELILTPEDRTSMGDTAMESYISDFKRDFVHRKYFDSIFVSLGYDSLIYKTNIK